MKIQIDLKELEKEKEKNFQERLEFVQFWAEYVRDNSDEKWSKAQKVLIDSQIKSTREMNNVDPLMLENINS